MVSQVGPALLDPADDTSETIDTIDHVTVVVPAHDEARHIERCLSSLAVAVHAVAGKVAVDVVVVLDACTDGTTVREHPHVRVLEVAHRNVGDARSAGFREAARGPSCWYATTDADCEVPPDWLAVQIERARTAEVFVGTVDVPDWSVRHRLLRGRFEDGYTRASGHRHVHGANLGVSAVAYWAVGGFASLRSSEDVDLVERLVAAGFVVDWNSAATVLTSARRSDRTPDGFSAYLSGLERELPA